MKTQFRIGIDLSMVDESKAGIGYYAYALSRSLINNYSQNEYFLYTNNSKHLTDLTNPNTEIVEKIGKINLVWHLRVLRDISKRNIDFFVSPSNFFYGIYFRNTIQVVHDVAPISHPESFKRQSARAYSRQLKKLMRSKSLIATNSHSTLNDLVRLFPSKKNKIQYIGTGVSGWLKPQDTDPSISHLRSQYLISPNYILSIGTLQPRKNYINAIKAFYEFQKEYPGYSYVVVGKKGWMYKEILDLSHKLGIESKVKFLGYQDEGVVRTLLANSKIFLQASVWEGFGLPLLEAMYFSLPIAASDISVFREVIDDNAFFFDPLSVDSILSALVNANSHKISIKEKALLKEYDWDKVTNRLMQMALTIDKESELS